jgi:hypothetical protein
MDAIRGRFGGELIGMGCRRCEQPAREASAAVFH